MSPWPTSILGRTLTSKWSIFMWFVCAVEFYEQTLDSVKQLFRRFDSIDMCHGHHLSHDPHCISPGSRYCLTVCMKLWHAYRLSTEHFPHYPEILVYVFERFFDKSIRHRTRPECICSRSSVARMGIRVHNGYIHTRTQSIFKQGR